MELSAVLTLRDKLSAQMDKASKSVSAMTQRVNESKDAISKIAATQNINISANSNISEMVSAAQIQFCKQVKFLICQFQFPCLGCRLDKEAVDKRPD